MWLMCLIWTRVCCVCVTECVLGVHTHVAFVKQLQPQMVQRLYYVNHWKCFFLALLHWFARKKLDKKQRNYKGLPKLSLARNHEKYYCILICLIAVGKTIPCTSPAIESVAQGGLHLMVNILQWSGICKHSWPFSWCSKWAVFHAVLPWKCARDLAHVECYLTNLYCALPYSEVGTLNLLEVELDLFRRIWTGAHSQCQANACVLPSAEQFVFISVCSFVCLFFVCLC